MKNKHCSIILFCAALSGCASDGFKGLDVSWDRQAFGTDLKFNKLLIDEHCVEELEKRIKTCDKKIEVEGTQSAQTEALKAVAEGTAKGLSDAAKAGLIP